ncbi:zinc finger protein 558 [Drosophila grimshawi]|uniref:GH19508 n=1 Tax=Drosophila grimshawi TaxID=7222 RepID=B4JGY3_DROGR|nr:zinc finger protein 558 [Drosophila grimshawi]EDV93761.1 GH19508 [Drosophila grimshawi]
MKCAVHNCTNKFKSKQKHSEQLSFFSFPKNPDILKKWVAFCRKSSRDKLKATAKSVICNEHFKEDDIQGALQFQMGLCSKRTLRPGAVPCINNNDISALERERSEKKKNKKLVAELLEEASAREAAEASGAIVIAPNFIRNTGINSVPDFVSATGNAFVPFTPTPIEHDPLAEELDCSTKSSGQDQRLVEQKRCRTCFAQFVLDESSKDLCDSQNAVMLYHIEVITGIWIQCKDEGSAVMCSSCVANLRTAIAFREACIRTELQLAAGVADVIPAVINESISEDGDGWDEQPDGHQEQDMLVKDEFVSVFSVDDTGNQTTVIEPLSQQMIQAVVGQSPSAADPNSIALGAQIYEDLLNEYKGKDKTPRPRQKRGIVAMQKPAARQRKRKPREPKPIRPKRTKEERNRIRREQIRAMPLNYVCDQCGASFRVRCNLTIHMLRHTRTKNYTCPECPKKFYDSYMRNIHLRVRHRGELPFTCNFCKKAFGSSNTRYLHEKNVHGASPRIHRNENRLNKKLELKEGDQQSQDGQNQKTTVRHFCTYCDKSYATKYALNWHINQHIGVKPFKCKVCDMRFPDPQAKKKHEVKHDSKRPYECDICLKGFYVRCKLKEHERIHTGERPYRCDVCNALFRYKFNLYSHQFSKMHKENVQKVTKMEIIEDSN